MLDEGQFGIDVRAAAILTPGLSWHFGYAFEKVDEPGPILKLLSPDADKNIHQFNTHLVWEKGGLLTVLEHDQYFINPLDTDIWDIMVMLSYRFKNGFGLAFRYSHEDIDTPFGDGKSNSFTLSPTYRINDKLLIRLECGLADGHIANLTNDVNHQVRLETLYDF